MDDGLAIIQPKNSQVIENKKKKKTIKVFKDIGFKITIDTGSIKCNLLIVTLDICIKTVQKRKHRN